MHESIVKNPGGAMRAFNWQHGVYWNAVYENIIERVSRGAMLTAPNRIVQNEIISKVFNNLLHFEVLQFGILDFLFKLCYVFQRKLHVFGDFLDDFEGHEIIKHAKIDSVFGGNNSVLLLSDSVDWPVRRALMDLRPSGFASSSSPNHFDLVSFLLSGANLEKNSELLGAHFMWGQGFLCFIVFGNVLIPIARPFWQHENFPSIDFSSHENIFAFCPCIKPTDFSFWKNILYFPEMAEFVDFMIFSRKWDLLVRAHPSNMADERSNDTKNE